MGNKIIICISKQNSAYPFILILMLFSILTCSFTSAQTSEGSDTLDLTAAERSWLDSHPGIQVAYDGFDPPYSFVNSDGQLEGFSVDLLRVISKKTGIRFQVYPEYKRDRIYQFAQRGQVDMVATMVEQSDELKGFSFTKPYIFKSLIVISRSDDDTVHQRNDIVGKKVAMVGYEQYKKKILTAFPSITPYQVDTVPDALNVVSLGDADVAIVPLGAAHYYRNKNVLTNLKYAALYQKHFLNESIAVRTDWPELRSILNKGLASISETEMQKLRAKWLPVEYMENLVDINLTKAEEQWIADHPVIRLGIDPEFAPFEYVEDGLYQGMASDYVKLLNQRLHLNMVVVEDLEWQEVMTGARVGRIDVLPAVGKTDERTQFLLFTDPYLNFHRVIVTRDDEPFVSGLYDLRTLKVALQANTSHHGYILENSDIDPMLFDTLQESLMAVSGGKADAFVGNVASTTYWIRKLNLTNLKIAAPVSSDVQSLHFAVRKDWPELVSILQKGLDSITDQQRQEISEKWLSFDYDATIDYTLVWQVAAVFTILVIIIMLWNILLNRTVRLRTSQLEYTANYDQLTALPNRFLILDRLTQRIADARHKQEKLAVMSIDLDDFKKINDALGHHAGDEILKEFAIRLKNVLPDNHCAGRLGADQFLVVQSSIHEAADSAALAERIIADISKQFETSSEEISLTASLGIALFPDDGASTELLLKHADTATHHAKEHMRGRYAFYTENLNRSVSRKLELERYIHGALKRNELEVYYQPKINARNRRIVSFEALVRWCNSELGMVSPAEFVPIAEKNGMIENIGFFVLKEAMATLAHWQSQYDSELSMAINLSPVQFRSDDLIQVIESVMLNNGLDSRHIEFEITEGVLLTDYEGIEDKLRKLKALGITLAMDDFGTGYSSLSYLRKYKFDTLKIDREFISDLPTEESDRKLVAATIAMAHELGMTVVAEGVETEQQDAILVQQGCDLLQGWLFSKALPAAKMTELLKQQCSST
ncbi:EAL domain-containing protein [Gynuella sunshinyii]|uniref:Putative signal transduction protein containing a membrane domain, an EAL and a GGDEF domain n=1 Tax=Gynuella sunshinyii YC6258 TaxID=1445510 RepID=A0A0C5V7Y9_9GAMM|nr:transporter substrate-binding domain-containing protein [Gynuella sunshinyii]AJQ95535.1 putative signal transduction protein containing a membrane domain, an EAL and a GGDEF domain [Gynuella sunshinyii YC6258]